MNAHAHWRSRVLGSAIVFMLSLATNSNVLGIEFTITTADRTGGDASIKQDAPDTNYDRDYLEVRYNKYWSRHTYFHWDLAPFSTAPASDVEMSVMAAFIQDLPVDMDVYGLNDTGTIVADETWDEHAITWNNAPGNDPAVHGLLEDKVTLLGTLTADVGTQEGDILTFSPPELTDFINADTNGQVTLILVNNSFANIQDDYSVQLMRKESTDTLPSTGLSYAPTLTADFDLLLGDMNGDQSLTTADVSLFVQALTDRAAFDAHAFPVDADVSGDVNLDGTFDTGDIAAFDALTFSPSAALVGGEVPEPAGGALLAMAIGCFSMCWPLRSGADRRR